MLNRRSDLLERGFDVDHSSINRWVLAYAPMIEKRLRRFRKPHCGSVRIDETCIKIRGRWHYLCRALDTYGNPVDFLLTAKRDLEAARRLFARSVKTEAASGVTNLNRVPKRGAIYWMQGNRALDVVFRIYVAFNQGQLNAIL